MKSSLLKFLVDQDIYGHKIGVQYRGSDAYKTKTGSTFTLATYVLMCFNLFSLMLAFKDGSLYD